MTSVAPMEDPDTDDLPIIDEAHLTSFTDADPSLEQELAELFIATAHGYLRRMKEALVAERPWSAEAHALKGAGANLGARRVAAQARKAEFAPPSEQDLESLHAVVEEVRTYFADRSGRHES